MSSYSFVCSLCFDDKEKDLLVLNQSIQDMLGTLLIYIDISAIENAVICRTCHRKLEKHYCFKKKCMFTEDTLSPFVTENVKMNLNEIYNQINKSEIETEKNVCRLCLQYSDDDMTLNEDERQQFEGLFPEINLKLTNFVILCLTCYNTLHKYFMFVTSFYSNKIFDTKSSINAQESDEKNVLSTGAVGIKNEGGSIDLVEEKLDIGVEQTVDIESVDIKPFLMDIEQNDDIKPLILQEELNIKSDEDSFEGQFFDADSSTRLQIENQELGEPNCDRVSSRSLTKKCPNRQKDCVSTAHSNLSKIKRLKCEECNYQSNHKSHLKQHMLTHTTNLSEITMYKCHKCDYEFKRHYHLKRHIISKHTDPSEILMHKCKECSYKTKHKVGLKQHMLTHATNLTLYKCDKCDFESKWSNNLKFHIISKHTDPSEIQMNKCKECSYETKHRKTLKRHMLTHATNPSEITMYKCDKCDFESKWSNNLKFHIISKHTDPSEIQMNKCQECSYETKYRKTLKRHMRTHATNLSKITTYKCHKCDYEFKRRDHLKRHFISKHTDPSEILMHKCKECSYKTKHKIDLKQHMLTHATNLSEITMYKCDKCEFETKWRKNLKQHCIRKHIDPSKIEMIKCK